MNTLTLWSDFYTIIEENMTKKGMMPLLIFDFVKRQSKYGTETN